jgi:hypothetical protein
MTETNALLRALALLLAVGCAAVPAQREDRRQAVRAAEADLLRNERELNGLMAAAAPVDCARATVLSNNICTLAERICELGARMPEDASGPARCTDARQRCQNARARVQGACK